MTLPIPVDHPPMEAQLTQTIPSGEGWLYEPKWDGFRCLVFRDGAEVDLRSKASKPLSRYFPDLVEVLGSVGAKKMVLDGEIVIPVDGALVFDELLLRMHPAESRVKTLAAKHTAHLIVFDVLVDPRGKDLTKKPLSERRILLEELYRARLADHPSIHISPATDDETIANRWLSGKHGGLDGVMAKRLELPYMGGERTGMKKIKRMRSADCVVGGFRWSKTGRTVGSLLLGLFDDDGDLNHVGFCSALSAKVRKEADERLIPLRGGKGFSGRTPSARSRWRREGSGEWESVAPEIVVEVEYDHFSGGRFRHGTRFGRWRPDKEPGMCTMEQVEKEGTSAMGML